jgi:DHA2 family methylenomycin A resistance protein-like MFS transporter
LTFGAIEAGAQGFASPLVIAAFAVAALAAAGFLRTQQTVRHPMLPLELFGSRTVVITVASGFAFMVGYYGLPFVISLFLQQHRGLTALQTGVVFLPMMIIGAVLTPFSARIGERVGRKTIIVTGLALMTAGLAAIGLLPAAAPLWVLAVLMMLVGLGGPTVSPPATAALLDAVPERQAGVASGCSTPAARSAAPSRSPCSVRCSRARARSCAACTPACSWPPPCSPSPPCSPFLPTTKEHS